MQSSEAILGNVDIGFNVTLKVVQKSFLTIILLVWPHIIRMNVKLQRNLESEILAKSVFATTQNFEEFLSDWDPESYDVIFGNWVPAEIPTCTDAKFCWSFGQLSSWPKYYLHQCKVVGNYKVIEIMAYLWFAQMETYEEIFGNLDLAKIIICTTTELRGSSGQLSSWRNYNLHPCNILSKLLFDYCKLTRNF